MNDLLERPEVVRLDGIRKTFVIRQDNTLKDRVLSVLRRRRRQTRRSSFRAVDDVSLSIHAGTTVGLLGANGSGKSTLLKMIGGILSPDSGQVHVRGRIAALLELGAGFHPDLSGRENVYLNAALLGLTRAQTTERFDDIVDFSGIRQFIDNEVKFYSSGMYMRLAFAVAVHTDPDILLVDEVLAVGDEAFQRKCMDKIRAFQQEGRTIIIVSHAASQIADLCDTTFVLQDGKVAFEGPPREGISALRELLAEKQRRGRSTVTDLGEADTVVAVTGIEALDAAGEAKTTFTQDESVTLRLHVEAIRDVAGWSAEFGIDTPGGQLLVGTGTEHLDLEMPALTAGSTHYADFTMERLNLAPGDYVVNARATDATTNISSVLWQGAMIHVTGREIGLGLVDVQVSAREQPASPPA
jgi:ABC-2 type transport system ATP-binding protein